MEHFESETARLMFVGDRLKELGTKRLRKDRFAAFVANVRETIAEASKVVDDLEEASRS